MHLCACVLCISVPFCLIKHTVYLNRDCGIEMFIKYSRDIK